MAFEHKPGSGTLFPNKFKQSGDKKPDYKGTIKDLDGNQFQVAGWMKDGKGGQFISLMIEVPREKQDALPEQTKPVNPPLACLGQNPEPDFLDQEEMPF